MAKKKPSGRQGCPRGQALIDGECFKKTEIKVVHKEGICPDHKGKVPMLVGLKEPKMPLRCGQCFIEFLKRNQYEKKTFIFVKSS